MEQPKYTIEQLNQLESSKTTILHRLDKQLKTLEEKKGGLLLQLASKPEVKKQILELEKEEHDLHIEYKSTELILTAIPKYRDFARADEIESEINSVQEIDQVLVGMAPKIDASIEGFVLLLQDYYGLLEKLYQINPELLNVRGSKDNVLDSISFFLHKYGLWERLKIGKFRDYQIMAESKYGPHRVIAKALNILRDRMEKLRGEA
jgi:hypothetical protein